MKQSIPTPLMTRAQIAQFNPVIGGSFEITLENCIELSQTLCNAVAENDITDALPSVHLIFGALEAALLYELHNSGFKQAEVHE
jgi:hypothetical protein